MKNKLKDTRVLVTGLAGIIGQVLVRRLVAQEAIVFSVDIASSNVVGVEHVQTRDLYLRFQLPCLQPGAIFKSHSSSPQQDRSYCASKLGELD